MNNFPQDRHQLLRANYKRLDQGGKTCNGCSAPIEWWKTTNGKKMPMNPMPEDHSLATAHFSTCPNAKQFKGVAEKPGAPPAGRFAIYERDLRALRDRAQARVIVMVDEFGTTAAWADGIPAEDLRQDLISAGNFVRNEIAKGDPTL
jgi:hypothetical protein